jgi:predicted ribosomally synthesized peptide with SipW-like signal peptide
MDKKKIISLLAAGVMMVGITVSLGTGAWFTDNKTSKVNVFNAGTLKLGEPGTITSGMPLGNIYPGWTESKTVTIDNKGSLPLKYKMSVTPLIGNILFDGQTPLQVNVNNQGFVDINKLGEVFLGQISASSQGTFNLAFKLPQAAGNDYASKTATFDFNFTAAQLNDTSFTVNSVQQLVVIKSGSDLSAAINNQKDGQTWVIKAGNYSIARNNDIMAGGQPGWYMPLTANNLTIIGEGNPVIYGNEYSANGVWATQDLVAAFGNNITLKGLTLMPKLEGNKTVEVIGANFRIEDCTITPNTLAGANPNDNYEDRQWGGSLYFNGAGNHVVKNVTIKNGGISFRYSPAGTNITLDNVNIINNTNIDWINQYRYSGGFNNANCSKVGMPKVTYVIDNTMNNYASVINNAKPEDTIIDKVSDEASLKSALADSKISNIELSQDITLTSQASITRAVNIDGKNHAVKGSFTKTDNSNNSLIGIMDNTKGVTIKNLTVDGAGSTKLHGINIASATDITLENVTSQNNPNAGITVNSSLVTVKNITTKHNGWGGINVALGSVTQNIPSQLTVVGASVHDEAANDIWIDKDTWTNVSVTGDIAQYTKKTVNGVICYNLN